MQKQNKENGAKKKNVNKHYMTNKLISEAKAKEKDGDILGAIGLYKSAWREDSRNIFLQIQIGNLSAIIEEYEEAAGFFRRSHHVLKDNLHVIDALSFCLNKIGNSYFINREFKLAASALPKLLNVLGSGLILSDKLYALIASSYLF